MTGLAPRVKRLPRIRTEPLTLDEQKRVARMVMREGMKIPAGPFRWMGIFSSLTEEIDHIAYVRQPTLFVAIDPSQPDGDCANYSELCFDGPLFPNENGVRIVAVGLFIEMEGGKPFFITPVEPVELEPNHSFVVDPLAFKVIRKPSQPASTVTP